MIVRDTPIAEVRVVEPRVFHDARGFFLESFNAERFAAAGLPTDWAQDNHSRSTRDVLRGLHFQRCRPQGKLVRVVRGAIWDVAVDIRRGSPTFGRWVAEMLSDENQRMLWVPPGFAHGFCVLSDVADVTYKCTALYEAEHDRGVLWSDPTLQIPWPTAAPILSEKDRHLPPLLAERDDLPSYVP
ncbi:MAG TPA: dTDP-4-dehydrorhamnose 3,5-epimerase [Gemmatimonadales bacterium]|nr:dTDP-4-dehydrorhamnose 3,5-epimerase [Gemmatimonadales bacterium]